MSLVVKALMSLCFFSTYIDKCALLLLLFYFLYLKSKYRLVTSFWNIDFLLLEKGLLKHEVILWLHS